MSRPAYERRSQRRAAVLRSLMEERCLGDGVWAFWDGRHIVLTTGQSISSSPSRGRLWLTDEAQAGLVRMMDQMRRWRSHSDE